MRTKRFGIKLLVASVSVAALAGPSISVARGQSTFQVISGLAGFIQPSGVTEGAPGVFYGVAAPACAFSVTYKGALTSLACFPNGTLTSVLVSADNGRFYSGEWVSGSLTASVFSVSAKPDTLKAYPQQKITPTLALNLPDGTLVGWGDSQATAATYLIRSDTQGNVAPIVQFPNSDLPSNNVTYGKDGNFYGVAQGYFEGSNYSYVYRVTPAGALKQLYSFGGNLFGQLSNFLPLVQASDGNFYGVAPYGASTGGGTFYKVTLAGQYTLLYTFPTTGASSYPQYLIQASDGNFYGTTLGSGGHTAFFRVTSAGQYATIHTMTSSDGQCPCELVQGSDGLIYGIAHGFGPTGGGSFFAVDLGLAKPAPQALSFRPRSGAAGAQVRIWGYNLLKASVQFNGVSATAVRSSGPNYVWATVPSGATSGPITVTTPGGSSTTSESFTVQ